MQSQCPRSASNLKSPRIPLGLREDKVLVKLVRPTSSTPEWKPDRLGRNPASNGLVVFRKSNNWFIRPNSEKRLRVVPYIDRNGLIHAVALCSWVCSSHQLFATIVSTVYKRLISITRSIPHKKRVRDCNLYLKIAIHYAYTNDDSWYKRCLSMLFNYDKNIVPFIYKTFKNVDANKGFLYDQALKNASWFKRHSRSPRKCDKSTINAMFDAYLRHPATPKGLVRAEISTRLSDEMSRNWVNVYTYPKSGTKYLSAINSPPIGGKSSLLFRGNLDLRTLEW